MPGHKGRGPLGCEELDITEIPGADSLYEASGIIAESEANASALFGCPTFYSTEGSSHCIRAMLFLAMQYACADTGDGSLCCRHREPSPVSPDSDLNETKLSTFNFQFLTSFRVLAARNVHRTFLSAAALLDLDVVWLPADGASYLSANPAPEVLDRALAETGAGAVYLTCPDYLGCLPDLRPLAEVCHAHNALLLVDNAHGAYLRFLNPSRHPMDLGADLCCDSAHKTLPVLTGGAYLHVRGSGIRDQGSDTPGSGAHQCATVPRSNEATGIRDQGSSEKNAVGAHSVRQPLTAKDRTSGEEGTLSTSSVRDALALFGSTSPSYLILQSLDLANPFLERLPALLEGFIPKIDALKRELAAAGYRLYGQEPLKLTLCPRSVGLTGTELAKRLEAENVFCEFADPDFLVLMFAPIAPAADLSRLRSALLAQAAENGPHPVGAVTGRPPAEGTEASDTCHLSLVTCHLPDPVNSLRAALLSPCERVPAAESLGRVLARPGVSCPPAVPILMPGERIDEAALAAFRYYGVETVDVLMKSKIEVESR